ncbi:S46 family peptidase [Bythopirellula polymerisocia]|uniref:Dipeptidyl-peptidase n=1 Tax=Bythopirellula polymerisocia TaxID=2528003 RepID=A0A5C6CCG6_9BACT|nr:S46 family peptidase [Bythopirellula polymerisocia]TWU21898.1 Peptidase S46 [Bythopirellula polymerisocia]
MSRPLGSHCYFSCLIWLFFTSLMLADEGMWLFNDLPREILKQEYNFEPTQEWADHIMLSSVRFSSGGSASFVSSNGLVLTNHHVAADTLHKLSTPEFNYYENGFLANGMEHEIKAPDLELNQLVSIEDVTERINAAVASDLDPEASHQARRAAMAVIEQESLDKTGLRSDVITLFGGAKYHLYRYKKYTDVRLVWAPESTAAFFGGDMDNFEFPRYNMDVTIFRVYEDGKPAKIEHFLKWSEHGAGDGEVVFVSGNPARTDRGLTTEALKTLRDHSLPFYLDYLCRMEVAIQQFAYQSPEHQRRGQDELFGIQNSRKAITGMLVGLQDPQFIAEKATQEDALLVKVNANLDLKHFAEAWKKVSEVQPEKIELLNGGVDFRERYYEIAKELVLKAAEDQKPSEDRLREFSDSGRESLEHELFSPATIYDDLEVAKLSTMLSMFVEQRGGDDPLVIKALNGKNPFERAAKLIGGSQLNKVDVRRELVEGGVAAIEASTDPMIQFFRSLEAEYRKIRKRKEALEEIERQAYSQIEDARVAVEGTSGYPDATFTLRLSFGVVKGYEEDGREVPPWTTFAGAFAHQAAHEAKEPWKLPPSWNESESRIDLETPLNFVSTADIIGGNSGSPVVNRAGEFVGIIFDGNIQSLTADYLYDDEVSRAVSVHSSGIREALKSIYNAKELAEQLGK